MNNPIIPGFYPDPSICRVGDRYFIANSSFEYFPGVPISTSSDLVHWRQIGSALDRSTQMPFHAGEANSGIYAPTLRYHNDRFWLVTTNLVEVRRGHLIVSAENPAGPWTDPVYVAGTLGIDPDLAWDEDGTCHLTWASFAPDLHGIVSAPVDPLSGTLLAPPRRLWAGSGLASAEGPHLYRIADWWYLLLAEGGTERGHAVTVARARTLDGPFEAAPSNPILSHRSINHPVQNTGHADLVELADGSWAMVYLGVRTRGQTPRFHVNGRETFLAGIDWIDGWPRVDEDRFPVEPADTTFIDRFSGSALDPRWIAPGAPPESFAGLGGNGCLSLTAPTEGAPDRLLGFRARDASWIATARLRPGAGAVRLLVRLDGAHWYGISVDAESVEATLRIGPATTTTRVPRPSGDSVTLRITATEPARSSYGLEADQPDLIELAVVREDGSIDALASADGRYLSTEVAGGFTGRVIGLQPLSGTIVVDEVRYLPGTATQPSGASD
ncbi:glycoside hydrolase family 43 protein [Arthrobacter sp. efr-133-TYG-118]|uniref:glycoside hydrolase family 43 protein n=1 Tax=Arthrobacter sp. efr-133-TYG-118 TaxID=3040279 RepID=UPI00254D0739|nr:glycoside hydrolase family 43 protein [Arthrobacter sp. efr-133-TYG-118]